VLSLAHDSSATADASAILAFETTLAAAQWTSVENRDPVKTYNRIELAALERFAPGLHWNHFVADLGLNGRTSYVNISEPTYFRALGKLVQDTPVSVWRAYFRWSVINYYSPFLSTPFGQEQAAFSRLLSGAASSRPRWLRAVGYVDDRMDDALGRAYSDRYFTAETRARAETLIRNLAGEFSRRIEALDWMSADTKREAQAKLAMLTIKLGQPAHATNYTALRTSPTDLIGNTIRARLFKYDRDIDKLGTAIDRNEWSMSALAVNGSYSAVRNEIILPAALIQPPYFQSKADDAVNYGGLGWFIAHELSHAFDNRGNQYDSRGNLRDWWTPNDHAQFAKRSAALVAQYSQYQPVPGMHINGELTVGENIADNLGLAIAYDAYHHSLGGRTPTVLDGLTGDQRFFMSFAAIWAGRDTDANLVRMIKTDTHSPGPFRVRGTVVNQDPFYAAFDVHDGDGMYVPPSKRVQIW
jgi:predicted metalloendopeptidase